MSVERIYFSEVKELEKKLKEKQLEYEYACGISTKLTKDNKDLRDIITGLCEIANKCPECYNGVTGSDCDKCGEYYAECNCTPLTRKEIEDVFAK